MPTSPWLVTAVHIGLGSLVSVVGSVVPEAVILLTIVRSVTSSGILIVTTRCRVISTTTMSAVGSRSSGAMVKLWRHVELSASAVGISVAGMISAKTARIRGIEEMAGFTHATILTAIHIGPLVAVSMPMHSGHSLGTSRAHRRVRVASTSIGGAETQ